MITKGAINVQTNILIKHIKSPLTKKKQIHKPLILF